jgi:DNA-binding FadR family transcriptional regulator
VSVAAGTAGYRMRGLQGRLIEALGEAIVSGRFRPGEALPREPELMATFGASRTSVREALKVLAAKGLVETRQKVGTRVRPADLWNLFDADVLAWHHRQGLSEAILRDLIELRQVIEPAAARFAAGRATIADLREIERAFLAMERGAADLEAYERAGVAFHLAVFAASHNALLRRFAHIVADFLELSFHVQQAALNEEDNRIEDDIAGHRAVFDAINRCDGNAAAEAMLGVVLNGKSSLLRALEAAKPG